jgi:RiboL-PSP-HEPN
MLRSELDLELARIDELVNDINAVVPATSTYQNVKMRADLAGLLVVAIAASYENCVKEVLYYKAGFHHAAFEAYARRQYAKINSRINVSDLVRYCDLYDPAVKTQFKANLSNRKASVLKRTGVNIETMYEQLLDWRHDFAHAGVRNMTLEEATKAHLFGKRVLYAFAESLH